MLEQFIEECKKVEPRLERTTAYGHDAVKINGEALIISGYNFPTQAYMILKLMDSAGSFK